MSARVRYGLWICLGLAGFGLLTFLSSRALVDRGIPEVGISHGFHYEAADIEEKNVYIAWAERDGHPKHYLRMMTLSDPDNFNFSIFSAEYPYFRRADQVLDSSYQVVVKQKLPEASYVLEMSCGLNSVTLPLERQSSDTYVSSPLIPLNSSKEIDYFHGIQALGCKPGLPLVYNFKKIVSDAP